MNWQLTEWNSGVKLVNKPTGVVVKLGSDGHLNSIYTDVASGIIKLGRIIVVKYQVTTVDGKPQIASVDGGAPANLSPMIAKNTALDGRWYVAGDPNRMCGLLQSNLDKGLTGNMWGLVPDSWQDVNGKQNAAGFKRGISEARILEIVFGGKFRAHGIQVQGGRVRIELTVTIA